MRIRKQDSKGVITIFVSIMLISVLSLGTLVIEAGRYQAAKTQLAEANISASTSMIASYNSILYERYGLLAIDTSTFNESRCKDYVKFNSDLSANYLGNNITQMYSVSSVELQGLYNLTYPSVLKRQVLSRAKYHVIPQNYAVNQYNFTYFLSDLQNKCQYVSDKLSPIVSGSVTGGSSSDVNSEVYNALKSLYKNYKDLKKYDEKCKITINSSTMSLLPSATGTVESNINQDDIESIQNTLNDATNILGSDASELYITKNNYSENDVITDFSSMSTFLGDIKDVSSVSNISNTTITLAGKCKLIAQCINAAINTLSSDNESNLLLNSYISEYFSNRNNTVDAYAGPGKNSTLNGNNANFASACIEYIFGGTSSEITNQELSYDYVSAIFLINNLYSVMVNSNSYNPNSTYSTLAHIAWAYYETLTDIELMVKYNTSVPFVKYNMILDINNPTIVANAFAKTSLLDAFNVLGIYNNGKFNLNGDIMFTYRDSLALALWFVSNSTKMLRIADLIQLEMRYQEQYVLHTSASFLMKNQNTYCRVKTIAKFNPILPVIAVGTQGVKGISISSVKYAGY